MQLYLVGSQGFNVIESSEGVIALISRFGLIFGCWHNSLGSFRLGVVQIHSFGFTQASSTVSGQSQYGTHLSQASPDHPVSQIQQFSGSLATHFPWTHSSLEKQIILTLQYAFNFLLKVN